MKNARNDHAPPTAGPHRRPRPWRRALALAAALLAAVVVGANAYVVQAASPHIVAAAEATPADCIVVPGARIHADGRPYSLLVDRLVAAEALWRRGCAPRIVLSGRGGGGLGEDEVAAMRRFLAARGVPAAAMVDDPLGLRTIDTMVRCRDVFGMKSALVVTNPFHVARSVYLARRAGLDARGVEAPYGHAYSFGTMLRNRGRECLARVVACLDVHVHGATSAR